MLRELESACDVGQRGLPHQVGPHARQVTFVSARKTLEQQGCDHEIQHPVAEKLHAFVVLRAVAAMGERLNEHIAVAEAVVKRRLEPVKLCSHYRTLPIRLGSLKFIHTMKARPTMYSSGTKPQ